MSTNKFTQNIVALLFLALLMFSCSDKPTVKYNIPEELEENKEAVEIIEDMALAVSKLNKGMQEAAKFSIALEKGKSEMSMKQMLKSTMMVQDIANAKDEIGNIREKAKSLQKDLRAREITALNRELSYIEKQIGNIDTEALGLSKEEVEHLKNGGFLSFGSEEISPEKQARLDSMKAEQEYIEEQHKLHEQFLKDEGLWEEPDPNKNLKENILFGISVLWIIAIFVFILINKYRRGKSKLQKIKSIFKQLK